MAMENGPFEHVFPIEDGDFSIDMLVYRRVLTMVKNNVGFTASKFIELEKLKIWSEMFGLHPDIRYLSSVQNPPVTFNCTSW